MKRIQIIKEIAKSSSINGKRMLLVSNIGQTSRELYSVKDKASNFYMLGSMGLASSIGLGIALIRKGDEVIALDGDASVLMNLGSLSTIANFTPRNFHLMILDNQVNASTGGQTSNTSLKTDLSKLARAAGIRKVMMINDLRDLKRMLKSLPTVAVIRCDPSNENVAKIPLTARKIRKRFTNFVGSA